MKKIVAESVYFVRANFWSMAAIIGPFLCAIALLGAFVEVTEHPMMSWVYVVLSISGQSYYMCRLIKYMASVATGSAFDPSVSVAEWARLLIVHILYGVSVMVGMVALIIPGLYLSARLGFAEFETVLDDKKPFEALNASWQQTQEYALKLMFIAGIAALAALLFSSPITDLSDSDWVLRIAGGALINIIWSGVLLFVSVIYFRVYVLSRGYR
ncbi:hypothetical protein [Vibrio sp. WXL103]|uniref:hypothetical protein n=1 Tax=unclassified Vibrio TaxID=2614977 RepID=UPI003EC88BCF